MKSSVFTMFTGLGCEGAGDIVGRLLMNLSVFDFAGLSQFDLVTKPRRLEASQPGASVGTKLERSSACGHFFVCKSFDGTSWKKLNRLVVGLSLKRCYCC